MREVIPRRGPTCWLALGRRPKTSRKTLHSPAAFLGQSVTEVRPTASCAEKRLVGRTSSARGSSADGGDERRAARQPDAFLCGHRLVAFEQSVRVVVLAATRRVRPWLSLARPRARAVRLRLPCRAAPG